MPYFRRLSNFFIYTKKAKKYSSRRRTCRSAGKKGKEAVDDIDGAECGLDEEPRKGEFERRDLVT
jgi:hypothetical protein